MALALRSKPFCAEKERADVKRFTKITSPRANLAFARDGPLFLGVTVPNFAISLRILSDAFLKLISMIVAPIVFCLVVHGIASAGDLKKVGRVGVKALVYFEAMTTVALVVGLVLAYVFGPGHGINVDPSTLVLAGINILKFLAYLREELTIVLATASSDAVLPQITKKLERMGVKDSVVGLDPDRLFLQPRFVLDLPDVCGGLHRTGNHAAVLCRSPACAWRVPDHLKGRPRRAGLGDRDRCSDTQRGAEHSGDRARAGAFGRLVHRHGACCR
jgi:hypothetical protein